MSKKPGWQEFEQEVNEQLGLRATISSGNKWHDPGDGTDRAQTTFPLLVDAKYTTYASFGLSAQFLLQMVGKAQELGRRFVLPVRFGSLRQGVSRDYVVLTLHDFTELLDMARGKEN